MAVPNRPVSGQPIETTWGDIAHDTAVAMDIQAGLTEVALPSGSSDAANAITFARPFASPPIVVLGSAGTNNGANSGTAGYAAMAITVTATGFSARVSHATGVTSALQCSLRWIAYGPRA